MFPQVWYGIETFIYLKCGGVAGAVSRGAEMYSQVQYEIGELIYLKVGVVAGCGFKVRAEMYSQVWYGIEESPIASTI